MLLMGIPVDLYSSIFLFVRLLSSSSSRFYETWILQFDWCDRIGYKLNAVLTGYFSAMHGHLLKVSGKTTLPLRYYWMVHQYLLGELCSDWMLLFK